MATVAIGSVTIEYEVLELPEYLGTGKFIHHKISRVTLNEVDLRHRVYSQFGSIEFHLEPRRPDSKSAVMPGEYEEIFQAIFLAADELYKTDQTCLAASVVTFLFDSFTRLWRQLIDNAQHIMGIQLWREVLSLTHRLEKDTGKSVHKGSPYAFLAYTYLMIGDISTGFSYIYSAVEEDRRLNDVCPAIKYPDNAPVYLTATLVPDKRNIMFPLVSEVRLALEDYLNLYHSEFGSTLSMTEFDRRFLHNPDWETIKYYFVLAFWTIFEYRRKVTLDLMQNDFSRLKNADWLFSLCLVINRLLHEHPYYTCPSGYLGPEITNYVTRKGLMRQNDFEALRAQENFNRASPDQLIPRLLSASLQYGGVQVRREIQYLLVAWKLRNFSGHNIQIQNVIASRFEEIVKVLMCDIFLLVEEH